MNEKRFFRKEAADGTVIKEIQFGQVKTQTIIDGKPCYSKTNDIKRLGFKSVTEYIDHLTGQGYEEIK